MGKKEKHIDKITWIIVSLVILFFLIVIGIMLKSNPEVNPTKTKSEEELIKEEKTKTSLEVMNEIIEILKNEDKVELKGYLSNSFLYYYNENNKSKSLDGFLRDLNILSSSYEIERRGDTSQDDVVTYRIYWNVIEQNKDLGRASQYYCLQKITIILKKIVTQDIITYEIDKIILKDN